MRWSPRQVAPLPRCPWTASTTSRYQAVYTIPANSAFSPAAYSVEVPALDDIGEQDIEDAGALTVAARINQPPVLGVPTVTPRSLPAAGARVTIRATATEDRAVSTVFATITAPAGTVTRVTMTPTGSSTYRGIYQAPANATFAARVYALKVTARDSSTQQDLENAGTLSVAARVDQPPVLGVPTVTPRSLPAAGGAVTIRATATDDRAVSTVFATIAAPGGTVTRVTMTPTGSSTYRGIYQAPANATFAARVYALKVTARDSSAQQDLENAGALAVAAAPGPLTVSTTAVQFGNVRLGHRKQRTIVLRNSGPTGSGIVEVTLALSGSRFELVGSPTGVRTLRLSPGQSQVLTLAFLPSRTGIQTGRLGLARADGLQRGLRVTLTGNGVT